MDIRPDLTLDVARNKTRTNKQTNKKTFSSSTVIKFHGNIIVYNEDVKINFIELKNSIL